MLYTTDKFKKFGTIMLKKFFWKIQDSGQDDVYFVKWLTIATILNSNLFVVMKNNNLTQSPLAPNPWVDLLVK